MNSSSVDPEIIGELRTELRALRGQYAQHQENPSQWDKIGAIMKGSVEKMRQLTADVPGLEVVYNELQRLEPKNASTEYLDLSHFPEVVTSIDRVLSRINEEKESIVGNVKNVLQPLSYRGSTLQQVLKNVNFRSKTAIGEEILKQYGDVSLARIIDLCENHALSEFEGITKEKEEEILRVAIDILHQHTFPEAAQSAEEEKPVEPPPGKSDDNQRQVGESEEQTKPGRQESNSAPNEAETTQSPAAPTSETQSTAQHTPVPSPAPSTSPTIAGSEQFITKDIPTELAEQGFSIGGKVKTITQVIDMRDPEGHEVARKGVHGVIEQFGNFAGEERNMFLVRNESSRGGQGRKPRFHARPNQLKPKRGFGWLQNGDKRISRRSALKLLGGGVLGTYLVAYSHGEWDPYKKNPNERNPDKVLADLQINKKGERTFEFIPPEGYEFHENLSIHIQPPGSSDAYDIMPYFEENTWSPPDSFMREGGKLAIRTYVYGKDKTSIQSSEYKVIELGKAN